MFLWLIRQHSRIGTTPKITNRLKNIRLPASMSLNHELSADPALGIEAAVRKGCRVFKPVTEATDGSLAAWMRNSQQTED